MKLTSIDSLSTDGEEEAALLCDMAAKARSYVSSFSWCPNIKAAYLAFGIGKVVGVFLFDFQSKVGGTDDRLWVMVGDLPDAYLVVEPDDSAKEALVRYCELMDDWISAVLTFGKFDDVFPVAAPRTIENANLLRRRLDFLRSEIIPTMDH